MSAIASSGGYRRAMATEPEARESLTDVDVSEEEANHSAARPRILDSKQAREVAWVLIPRLGARQSGV